MLECSSHSTVSGPRCVRQYRATRSTSVRSLLVGGQKCSNSSSTEHPVAVAVPSMIACMRRCTSLASFACRVRRVPVIVVSSGIALIARPLLIDATVSTIGERASTLRGHKV